MDLSGVSQLIAALPRCEAVEFCRLFESLGVPTLEQEAPAWLATRDAQALLRLARGRFLDFSFQADEKLLQTKLEAHPKWDLILSILDEIIEEAMLEEERANSEAKDAGVKTPDKKAPTTMDVDIEDDSDLEVVNVVPAPPAKKPRLSEAQEPGGSEYLEPRVLIVVPDDRTFRQVGALLHDGSRAVLLDSLALYLKDAIAAATSTARRLKKSSRQQQQQQQKQEQQPQQQQQQLGQENPVGYRGSEVSALNRELQAVLKAREELLPESALQVRTLRNGRFCHPAVDVLSLDSPEGSLELQLHRTRPRAVILFEPSLEAIRALEVYCAEVAAIGSASVKQEDGTESQDKQKTVSPSDAQGRHATTVHMLAFEECIETFRFQQKLSKELKAVDTLIRSRKHLTVRLDDPKPVQRLATAPGVSGSRRGGGARGLKEMVHHKVVVDLREFRSVLPFMLYMRGLVVEPVTIPVGDYVLSRDICVERKAIPDLIQSLASGRLFQQAQNLCNTYANPTLMIEFDPGKSFALQNTYTIAKREVEVGARDLMGKLSLLVLHFPLLRFIWSPSQAYTADIFLKLKEGRYQPDPVAAAKVNARGLAVEDEAEENPEGQTKAKMPRTNNAAMDVLRKLPGVTARNSHALAMKAGTLSGVAKLSLEDLEDVMTEANARLLYNFVRLNVLASTAAPSKNNDDDNNNNNVEDTGAEVPEDKVQVKVNEFGVEVADAEASSNDAAAKVREPFRGEAEGIQEAREAGEAAAEVREEAGASAAKDSHKGGPCPDMSTKPAFAAVAAAAAFEPSTTSAATLPATATAAAPPAVPAEAVEPPTSSTTTTETTTPTSTSHRAALCEAALPTSTASQENASMSTASSPEAATKSQQKTSQQQNASQSTASSPQATPQLQQQTSGKAAAAVFSGLRLTEATSQRVVYDLDLDSDSDS